MANDNGREEDLLSYKNAHSDLESLIQSVLSSFAFSLENAALEEYHSETSYIPPETTRLVSWKVDILLKSYYGFFKRRRHGDIIQKK